MKPQLNPIHAMKKTSQTDTQSNPRVYTLKPAMTMALPTADPTTAVKANISSIVVSVSPLVPRSLPARQPLPTPVIDPNKPMLKLSLDVHLEFIMAVVQRGRASAQAPRKFTREQLVAHVANGPVLTEMVGCHWIRRRRTRMIIFDMVRTD